jgi:hypothetical protein
MAIYHIIIIFLPSPKLAFLFFLGFVPSFSARLRLVAGLGGLAYIVLYPSRRIILCECPQVNSSESRGGLAGGLLRALELYQFFGACSF